MRKYIFVDFDGVLNTEQYYTRLISLGDKTCDSYGPLFDPFVVEKLKTIIEATNAEIVIISSWKLEGVDRMISLWKDRNMPGTLLGCTSDVNISTDILSMDFDNPETFNLLACKGPEIKQWLDDNAPANEFKYVIQ